MAAYTTEGIILKRSNYGEADRHLTVLTPFRGKIRLVAKGVRRISSRRAGNIELLNKVRLQIFQATGLGVITEAESIKTYPKLKSDLATVTYATHVAELADKFLPEGQVNNGAYQLVSQILDILEVHPRQIFIRAFEIKLMVEMGFWSTNQIQVDDQMRELLTKLELGTWNQISGLQIDQGQAVELERVLRYYIEKILESSLKSIEMIKKIRESKK